MATPTNQADQNQLDYGHDILVDLDDGTDSQDSDASNETDDGQQHPTEKIIAEGHTCSGRPPLYLVKWKNCPLLRSSWQSEDYLNLYYPEVLADWRLEKKRQERGLSKPLDLQAFDDALKALDKAQRQRRILRRLKKKFTRVLEIVAS